MLSWYDRAAVIPGRSLTCSKAPGRFYPVGAGPLYCTSGDGAELLGDDGVRYIDMLSALGAISLGYNRTPTRIGGVYSLPHAVEVEAAEAVLKHVAPWASSVRFLKTGSEATHCAYRIAKKATGRRRVLIGDWAYHGWHSWSKGEEADVTVYQHGADLCEGNVRSPREIAAVFVEPNRWQHTTSEWMADVRAFCDRIGALLVFDSMIYGGRFALGGASEFYGVVPELETYGKAFGNGQSVAFTVGREAMQVHGEVASGTYSGDTVGLQAVCDTIRTYTTQPVIETLWARGRQLQEGLQKIAWDSGLFVCEGAPVHQRITFHNSDHKMQFSAAMVKRGVLWYPEVTNVNYSHTEAIIDQVLEAARESVQELR